MTTFTDDFYARLLVLAALWNIAIGLSGAVLYELTITLFFGPGAVSYNLISVVFYRLFMVAVIAFGIGYFIVSRDLSRNRAVLWLGLACKMILFAVFSFLFFTGRATVLAFITLIGDLCWSLLMLLFLWQTRERVGNNMIIG